MAEAAAAGKNGATAEDKPKAQHPVYTVIAVKDGRIEKVIDPAVQAASQKKACDRIADTLKDEKFTLGAFLTNSYKEFDYETETTVNRKAAEKEKPSLLVGVRRDADTVASLKQS